MGVECYNVNVSVAGLCQSYVIRLVHVGRLVRVCVCVCVRKASLRELDKAAELAIIGHSVGAFVSTLDAPHLKHFATNVVRDVTSWLVKLFRFVWTTFRISLRDLCHTLFILLL